jgi:hypothetical protein
MTKPGVGMRIKKAESRIDDVEAKAMAIGLPPEQLAHGDYRIADVRLEDGERATTYRTLLNRGGTAIERWINAKPAVFSEGEIAAIEYCQALWYKIDSKGRGQSEIRTYGRYLWIGQSEHEALAELAKLKERIPSRYWSAFEDVCRSHSSAADAGSHMATNSRSAIDAARLCTAFVAATVAMRLGL